MSSPTMWVPGRAISVSLRSDARPKRDAILEPQIDVRAVAEIRGEIVAQRQVAVEIRAEVARVEAYGRPSLIQTDLQTVFARQVDLRDLLQQIRKGVLEVGQELDAAPH